MKTSIRWAVKWFVVFQFVCLAGVGLDSALAASNIDDEWKYAWSENVGWQNWKSTNAQATVETTYLVGYVWAENIGWIKLGSDGGGPYNNDASDNWGVNRNESDGTLSGYAWSENVGWINFSPTHGGVTIDKNSPYKFNGYAWGENVGWIHFQNATPAYAVALDGPLVVNLISFTATGSKDSVALTWETASEIDAAGFHLLRRDGSNGDYARITQSLIPAEGSPTSGAAYTYKDTNVIAPTIYYYKLQEVNTSGSRSDYGPVSAAVGDAKVIEVTGPGTIDAANTAGGLGDIDLESTGTHMVSTGKYDTQTSNTSTLTGASGWWVVELTNPSSLTNVTLHFCPAAPTDRVYYWDGEKWHSCSRQAYENNCLEVTITNATQPEISDMSQLIFALVKGNSQIPTANQWGLIALLIFLVVTGGRLLINRQDANL